MCIPCHTFFTTAVLTNSSAMGRLFGILIWTLLFLSMNGQVLFDDMGDRQRSVDPIKTELQQFYQGIERMITKKLDGIENIVETKISNMMETITNTIVKEERTSIRNPSAQPTMKDITNIYKANETVSFRINKMAEEFGTNLHMLQDGIENFTLIFENKLNILDEIRNTCLYLSEQFLSGDDIIVLKFNKSYEEMSSQFLLNLPNHDLNFTAKRDAILGADCADILKKYPNTRGKNGVYNIMDSSNSSNTGKAKAVYCDMTTDNGGWTVIQRRVNGTVAFYRDWRSYKNGFGFADHEFWIGNDMLHSLTSMRPQELRVDMQKFKPVGSKAHAVYSKFSVGDEASKYKLEIFGYYRGNAGDSLTEKSNNMKFSTPDQDNDNSTGNCASKYKTAGWFNNCFCANINGLYANYEKTYDYSYLTWYGWNNGRSLKMFQMMIRPQV